MRPAYYLRMERGESLSDVADALDMGRGTLAAFERGERNPQAPTVKRLAEHYGVPVRELFEEPEAATPPAA
jgi:transcriptional regulator with XRE-family HTH domain